MFTTMFKDPEILDALTVIQLQQGLEDDELQEVIADYVRWHLNDIASCCMANHRQKVYDSQKADVKVNNSATRRERKPVTLQIHQERNRR